MQAANISSDEYALDRVFEAAGCRTQVELAEFLDIRQSSISDAKKRQSIPAEWLMKLLLRKGIHPEWILTGSGPRFMQPTEVEPVLYPAAMDLQELLRLCPARQLAAELIRRSGEGVEDGSGYSRKAFVPRLPRKGRRSPR